MLLGQAEDLFDRLAALGRDFRRRRRVASAPSSVARTMLYGLVEPWLLADDVGHAHHFEHGAHRAAGDDAGTVRRRRHEHRGGAVLARSRCDAACRSSARP